MCIVSYIIIQLIGSYYSTSEKPLHSLQFTHNIRLDHVSHVSLLGNLYVSGNKA